MSKEAGTLVDAIKKSIAVSMRPAEGTVPPVAILWTDAEGQWSSLIPALQTVLPAFYIYGSYAPEARTGPSIWLKCMVDRTLPGAPADGEIPILYLPHVSRQELRAAGDCPPALQPLVELQYRGRVWHQSNGHDWTVRAFLVSDEGLGLDVAGDHRTEEAFLRVLPSLAAIDVGTLRGKRLDAEDFDKLSVPDPVRDFLLWLNDPKHFESTAKGGRWESFCSLCQSNFGFNPEKMPPAAAAGRLLREDPTLDPVWGRFSEMPQLYPGVAKVLREPIGSGQGFLVLNPARDPRHNERQETELREALEAAAILPHDAACGRVLELEAAHAERRGWAWARTEQSPWAMALRHLAELARAAQKPVGGATLSSAAAAYASGGWETDRAAMDSLSQFRNGKDAALLVKIVRAIYEPWLDATARHFQSLIEKEQTEAQSAVGKPAAEKDTCYLFVDGLRFDLGNRVAAALEARSLRVNVTHRLAPLPTVTATAKVAASPVSDSVKGTAADDFAPQIQAKSGWKPVTAALMREKLEAAGVEILLSGETRIPSGANNGGWAECGAIDALGHKLQAELVHQLDAEIERIVDRVYGLLETGWRRVRVVTDHGWLLLPGELPKVQLASYLVETKWARCAEVKGQPDITTPVYSWYWNADIRIASPPGIASFWAGNSYAHGGVSPQECVVPELLVERGASECFASILSVEWRGMRCRVQVETNEPAVRVDLRTNWKQASTSIAATVKEVGASGEVSLAVPDDSNEGAAASVVTLDPAGNVLTIHSTCVGEES